MADERKISNVPTDQGLQSKFKRHLTKFFYVIAGIVALGTMIGWFGLLGWAIYLLVGLFVVAS